MALTNIIQEPRREITEIGMGIAAIVMITGFVYLPGQAIGTWFHDATGAPDGVTWLWTLIAMVLVFFGGWIVLVITHKVGELLCDNLARRGLELRPRRRR
jgi:hypothetical protein